MNLPDFVIIGAMKAATTSLHYYLNLHPQISMSKEKELNFFVKERNWGKGLDWYKSNFNGEKPFRGEASPNYTNFPLFKGVPERMHSVVPDIKLIYLVRDPIERILSQYVHKVADGGESRSLEQALSRFKANRYICRSQYFMQLEHYLKVFPDEKILVVSSEDLINNNRAVIKCVFEFLNVDSFFYHDKFVNILHKSSRKRRKSQTAQFLRRKSVIKNIDKLPYSFRSYIDWLVFWPFSRNVNRPVLSETLKQRIIDYLRDDIEQLRRFTGHKYSEWCL